MSEHALAVALQGGQPLLEAGVDLLRLVAGDLLGAGGLGGFVALAADVGQQALHLLAVGRDAGAGAVEHVVGHAQAGGDGQGVALAGQADGQAIGGRQALRVELHRGVLMPGVTWAKTLRSPWWVVATVVQPTSSRRSRMAWASAEPSVGVGAGGQLVQQHQAVALRPGPGCG